jgi:RNA polymerase sigma-70 factor (ECF subfamily)
MTVALPSALAAVPSGDGGASATPRPTALVPQVQAAAGPSVTFPAIFHECFPLVWRLLRTLGVYEPWLDDAAQEVFVIVYQKLPEFDGRVRITTWVHAIAYRVAANVRRRQGRERLKVELSERDAPSMRTPEHEALTGESARFVQAFCAGLSEPMRDVFVLCFLEEWGQSEVATLLAVSPNTVSSRVRLLRSAYRVALDQWQRQEAQR